ncbi:HpcH/HpaI aldolase/citrate lyase family protein [Rubrivivax albus]|uniref:HpcH/HpaI aldolase/citrate lyase family protein n=1 Tax=Rubrivivax albus TaxID=2499835 RepID=UPI0013050755|nr:aldolase/citrate lyase family protein [Rubrivivax albus]
MNTRSERPPLADPDLRRSWLFIGGVPGAAALEATLACRADVVIVDLEDFTPPPSRPEARASLAALLGRLRAGGAITSVRVNAPGHDDAEADLAAAMAAGTDIVALPMADRAETVQTLCAAIAAHESQRGRAVGSTELLPVCETARGVADVRSLAAASARVRAALLGAEDLAADLCAERTAEGIELAHARQRFLLDARAAGIEPIDAPCTFADPALAVAEARHARRLGYRCKALVRAEHVAGVHGALTPSAGELRQARAMVAAFEAARARGEDRALHEGLWVEVPTWRAALRLIERACRLGVRD